MQVDPKPDGTQHSKNSHEGQEFDVVLEGVLEITIGNKTMANTLTMGMVHQPVRGLAKFTGMSRRQMEALLLMFNGHFFKGLGHLLGARSRMNKNAKALQATLDSASDPS